MAVCGLQGEAFAPGVRRGQPVDEPALSCHDVREEPDGTRLVGADVRNFVLCLRKFRLDLSGELLDFLNGAVRYT